MWMCGVYWRFNVVRVQVVLLFVIVKKLFNGLAWSTRNARCENIFCFFRFKFYYSPPTYITVLRNTENNHTLIVYNNRYRCCWRGKRINIRKNWLVSCIRRPVAQLLTGPKILGWKSTNANCADTYVSFGSRLINYLHVRALFWTMIAPTTWSHELIQ